MLQQRCGVTPSLLAHILVSKYAHHCPFTGKSKFTGGNTGSWLPRQNLVFWVELAADWLRPIYDAIRTGVMAGGYVQVDETPQRFLAPGPRQNPRPATSGPPSRPGGDVFYRWEISRGAECLHTVLPVDFRGIVQCDGYSAYASFARKKDQLQLAGCWAHVRRKFFEARQQDPPVAGWLLRQIRQLYRLEKKLRRLHAGPDLRAAQRAHQARPVYARLHRALTRLKLKGRYLPRSGMGRAIDYTLNLWPQLGVYLDNGRIEIDQNNVENAIRPTAPR